VTGATRDLALDVAARLFAARGYRGTSLADVAQAAGLSNAGLLHHFPSKEQLLVEVLRRRDVADAVALDAGRGPEPTAWDLLDSMVELAALNSERVGMVRLYSTLSGEAIDADHPAHDWLREHLSRGVADLYSALEAGKAAGLVRPEAPSASIARSCIALLDGLQIQWLAGRVDPPDSAPETSGAAAALDIEEMSTDIRVFVDGLRSLWELPAQK
jgi:AcrR family transcriptional regulator